MRVVEIKDDDNTYFIRADTIESALNYWIENCADPETFDEPMPDGRFLSDAELDSNSVYDEDNGWTHTFRDALKLDEYARQQIPYVLAQSE